MDEATPFSAQLICKYSPGLNEAQRNICVEFPSVMSTLNDIPPVFYEQCVDQFRNDRWNCTSTVPPIFGESSSDLRRRKFLLLWELIVLNHPYNRNNILKIVQLI